MTSLDVDESAKKESRDTNKKASKTRDDKKMFETKFSIKIGKSFFLN
jgi:hypothetical protein